jgi:hypothetical protein
MAKKKATKRKTSKKAKGSEPEAAAVPGKGNPGLFPPLGGVGASLAAASGAKNKNKKGKKNSIPDVQSSQKTGDGHLWVDVALEAIKRKAEAMSLLKDALKALRPELEKKRVECSRRTGQFSSSVRVNNRLTYKTQSKFKEIPVERADAIRGIFGDDLFQRFFAAVTKIELNMDVLEQNPGLAQKIIGAIQAICEDAGTDVGDVLESKVFLQPTEEYSRARVMDAEVWKKHEDAEAAGLVLPYTPSLSEK